MGWSWRPYLGNRQSKDFKWKNKVEKSSCNQAMVSKPWLVSRSTVIKDKFLVSKIDKNDQYASKTSSIQIKFASEMNCNCDHFLHDECCFFDGNHKRVRAYVTLTASFYHSLLQQQVVRTTMQCKHENEKFIGIFWEQFNEAYKQIYITLLW